MELLTSKDQSIGQENVFFFLLERSWNDRCVLLLLILLPEDLSARFIAFCLSYLLCAYFQLLRPQQMDESSGESKICDILPFTFVEGWYLIFFCQFVFIFFGFLIRYGLYSNGWWSIIVIYLIQKVSGMSNEIMHFWCSNFVANEYQFVAVDIVDKMQTDLPNLPDEEIKSHKYAVCHAKCIKSELLEQIWNITLVIAMHGLQRQFWQSKEAE